MIDSASWGRSQVAAGERPGASGPPAAGQPGWRRGDWERPGAISRDAAEFSA